MLYRASQQLPAQPSGGRCCLHHCSAREAATTGNARASASLTSPPHPEDLKDINTGSVVPANDPSSRQFGGSKCFLV